MAKRRAPSRQPARNHRRGSSSRSSAPNRPSWWIWILMILVILSLAAAIFFFNQHPRSGKPHHIWTHAFSVKRSVHAIKESPTAKPAKRPEPEFEFYTALPEGGLHPVNPAIKSNKTPAKPVTPSSIAKVPSTPAHATATAPAPVTNKHVTTPPKPYYLQVASFPQLQDANKIKALLLLEAYNVNIQKTSIKGKEWYRVIVGPYSDAAAVQQAQTALSKTHHYTPIPLQ